MRVDEEDSCSETSSKALGFLPHKLLTDTIPPSSLSNPIQHTTSLRSPEESPVFHKSASLNIP